MCPNWGQDFGEMSAYGQYKGRGRLLSIVCASLGERGSVDELLFFAGHGEEAHEEADLGPQ